MYTKNSGKGATQARGIRNNNPGNIEKGQPWQGLMPPEKMNEAQRKETRFAVFESPKWGIRAIARTLITYQDHRTAPDGSPIDTVEEIVERWAPPSENHTNAYATRVRKALGLEPGETVDVHQYHHMRPLVEAIIRHENGIKDHEDLPYSNEVIDEALKLAGISKPLPPAHKDTETVVATTGFSATALAALTEVSEHVKGLIPYLDSMKTVFVVLSLVALGFVVYRIYEKRKVAK